MFSNRRFCVGAPHCRRPTTHPAPSPLFVWALWKTERAPNSLQYGSRSRSDGQATHSALRGDKEREKRSDRLKKRTGTKHGQHGRRVRYPVPALQCTVCGKRKRIVWPGGTLFVHPFLGVFFPGPDVVLVQVGCRGTLSDGESLTSPGPHSKSQMRCVSGSLIFPRLNALLCAPGPGKCLHTPLLFVLGWDRPGVGEDSRRHRLDVRTRYP